MIALAGPPIALDTLAGIVVSKVSFIGARRGGADGGARRWCGTPAARRRRAASSCSAPRSSAARPPVAPRPWWRRPPRWRSASASALAAAAAAVPVRDAMLYGASVAALGVVFAAIALCLAQVFTHSRAASGVGVALFGRGLRGARHRRRAGGRAGVAVADGLVAGHASARGPTRWWPLLVAAGRRRCAVGRAGPVAGQPPRPGRRAGRPCVPGNDAGAPRRCPARSGWRCACSGPTWSAGSGARSPSGRSTARSPRGSRTWRPATRRSRTTSGPPARAPSWTRSWPRCCCVMALLAAAYAASSALRLSGEEASGRLEQLLATGLTRSRWMLGLAGGHRDGQRGGAAGRGARARARRTPSRWRSPGRRCGSRRWQLVYLPAVLLLAALAALVAGLGARAREGGVGAAGGVVRARLPRRAARTRRTGCASSRRSRTPPRCRWPRSTSAASGVDRRAVRAAGRPRGGRPAHARRRLTSTCTDFGRTEIVSKGNELG